MLVTLCSLCGLIVDDWQIRIVIVVLKKSRKGLQGALIELGIGVEFVHIYWYLN